LRRLQEVQQLLETKGVGRATSTVSFIGEAETSQAEEALRCRALEQDLAKARRE
jgi:hypothetical protein